jgi:hypothetical protein
MLTASVPTQWLDRRAAPAQQVDVLSRDQERCEWIDPDDPNYRDHIDCATGTPLGVAAVPVFPERVFQLRPDDVLVVVTDDVTKARRKKGGRLDFFGSRGVAAAVRDALREGRDPAHAICSAAIAYADDRLADDASAVVSWLPFVTTLSVAEEGSE